MKFTLVFTDIHEYNKCTIAENYILDINSFDFYLRLLDERIDSIIVDVECERFPFTMELREFIKPNDIFDYDQGLSNQRISKI